MGFWLLLAGAILAFSGRPAAGICLMIASCGAPT